LIKVKLVSRRDDYELVIVVELGCSDLVCEFEV
jgi:hypothetical protein